jgi:hypothetical protein
VPRTRHTLEPEVPTPSAAVVETPGLSPSDDRSTYLSDARTLCGGLWAVLRDHYRYVIRQEDRPDPTVYVREPGERVHLMSIKTFMDYYIVKRFYSDRTITEEEFGYPEELLQGRSLDDFVKKVEYLAMVVMELMPPKR